MRITTLLGALVLCLANPALAQADQPSTYVKAGMPAPSRLWTGEDYLQAANVLQSKAIPLPRFADHDGAAILSRMTATDNLVVCHDQDFAEMHRYDECLAISTSVSRIITMYYATIPANAVAQPQPETAALVAYGLYTKASFLDVQKALLSVQPKDSSYALRAEGVRKSEALVKTAIAGAVKGFIQGSAISAADRSVVLKALSETLPTLMGVYSVDDREELRQRLVAARAKLDGADDLARIDTMLMELENPSKKIERSQPLRYKDV